MSDPKMQTESLAEAFTRAVNNEEEFTVVEAVDKKGEIQQVVITNLKALLKRDSNGQ